MRKFFELFVSHKRATILFWLIMLVYGYYSYLVIPKESDPDVKIPVIYVGITQAGISPEDAENKLLKPLETVYKSINGVKHLTSYASEGYANIILEFDAGADPDKALADVRNKTQDNRYKLPQEAKQPIIQQVDLSLMPVINIIFTGDMQQRALIEIARQIKQKIKMIPSVLEANLSGDRTNLVEILVDPGKIEQYKLNLSSVAQLIAGNNKIVASGVFRNKTGEHSLKIPSLIQNAQDLYDFPVFVTIYKVLKIKDIAEVRDTFSDETNIARVNGKPAVVIAVSKKTGANIIDLVEKIKKLTIEEAKSLPANLSIIFSQDKSSEIHDSISDLENGILFAGILVMIIIVLSMGVKPALLVALSLPTSFFAAIFILYLSGYTLNIVVLFSLILTVGMVVDDAIVVSEYAECRIEEGVAPREAFLQAATRMCVPIFTATLVKMIVFVPLLFWPGVIGKFMMYMPITVIAIMTCSLLFALLFQPAIGIILFNIWKYRAKNPTNPTTQTDPMVSVASFENNLGLNLVAGAQDKKDIFSRLNKIYAIYLRKVIAQPRRVVYATLGGLVAIYATFILFGPGVEFFPDIESDTAIIAVRARGDFSVQHKDKLVKQVEEKLFGYLNDAYATNDCISKNTHKEDMGKKKISQNIRKEVKVLYTLVNSSDSNFPPDTIGKIQLEFVNWQQRRKAKIILGEMKTQIDNIPGIVAQIINVQAGPKAAKPISINLQSYNSVALGVAADKLLGFLKSIPSLKDIDDSRSIPGMEWRTRVNKEIAARYKLTVAEIGNFVRLATSGYIVGTYQPLNNDDEIDIVIRFPKEFRLLDQIPNLKIATPTGQMVPLENFMTILPYPKVSKIKHRDGIPVITVGSDVYNTATINSDIAKIQKWLQDPQNLNEVEWSFAGDKENQDESSNFLGKAFMSAIILMFMVMLIQFNHFYHTFVVMSAVVLSTGGVLFGLMVTWQQFGIVMCGIGIIALAGIVLNNNILFVDTYQEMLHQGYGIEDSIYIAGTTRLRPILLTAATAAFGLLPLVIGLTINIIDRSVTYDAPSSQWWRQLAASITGGLIFATALTLFVTPALLMLGKRFEKQTIKNCKTDVKYSSKTVA